MPRATDDRSVAQRMEPVWEAFTRLLYQGESVSFALDAIDISESDLYTYLGQHPERLNEYRVIRMANTTTEGERRRRRNEDDGVAFEVFLKAFSKGITLDESIKLAGLNNHSRLYKVMDLDPTGQRRQAYEEARKASIIWAEERIEQIARHGATKEKIITRYDEDGNEVPYERQVTRGDDTRAILAVLRRRDPANWNDRLVSNVGTMIAQEQLDFSRLSNAELEAYLALQEKARVVDVSPAQLPAGSDPDDEE